MNISPGDIALIYSLLAAWVLGALAVVADLFLFVCFLALRVRPHFSFFIVHIVILALCVSLPLALWMGDLQKFVSPINDAAFLLPVYVILLAIIPISVIWQFIYLLRAYRRMFRQ